MRTLRQPRWIGLSVTVVVVSLLFARLGLWQWHRAQAKWRLNDAIATRAHAGPVPAQSVIPADTVPRKSVEWQRVTAVGDYEPARTVLRRDVTLDSARGYDVLVPLRLQGGSTLLVDRGFVPAPETGGVSATPSLPAPPSGTVTVTGLVRRPSGSPLRLDRTPRIPTVRAVAPQRIAADLGLGDVLDGYVMRIAEEPAPAATPAAPDLPEQDVGLNLAYMVQWWLFIVVAGVGWFVLLRREALEEGREQADGGGAGGQRPGSPSSKTGPTRAPA
jgi:cytochrome oxidase assembly protein ShyY1